MALNESVTAEKGVAVIAVMHDLNLALRFADTFILLSEGRVHASGGRKVITPDSVSEVYGVGVSVTTVNGRPVVVPL